MPFIRRQRKYYKDGVEVPSSSITDFGSYKYFKNVVTTKYWKEITTGSRELAYAAYSWFGSIKYAIAPLGTNNLVYDNKGNVITGGSWRNITESTAEYYALGMYDTCPRSYENDIYIDTTVTETVEGTPDDYTYTTEEITPVEVTANDDYDFTEFVPSTEFDYYEDKNKLYTLTRRIREYYKYGTELNATVTGSFAKIDKGVARGVSTSNYLTLPENFNVSDGSTWEMIFKFNLANNTTSQRIFGGHGTKYGLAIDVNSTGLISLYASSNGSSWNLMSNKTGSTAIQVNKDYWFKMKFTGTTYVVSLSTDGQEWVDEFTVESSLPLCNFGAVYLGTAVDTRDLYGTIDLKESYININGSRWWSGDSYTKVGSWIDDGVASGFSTSNYLTLPEIFTPSSNTWEQVYKITTGSDVSTQQVFVGNGGAQYKLMSGVQSGRFRLWLSSNNSTWDITDSAGSYTVLSSTEYYIRLKFTGTSYTLEYSLNGNEDSYITDIAVSSSTLITNSNTLSFGVNKFSSGAVIPFLGSIDLTQSYIKINNKNWWHGTKAVESTKDDADYYIDRNVSCSIINPKNYKTLQINAVPNNAIITINNEERNSITAVKGSKISWSVKAEGYASQSGIVILDEDTILNITLNSSVYEDGQVIFESATAGTYEVEIAQDGNYEVYCIGGGGGGAHDGKKGSGVGGSGKRVSSSGGSGSGFIGVVSLLAGSYNISIGSAGEKIKGNSPVRGTDGGDSYIDTLIIAYGGKGGYVPSVSTNAGTPGAGGAIPSVTVETTVVTLNTQGNTGSTRYATGGTSNLNLAGGASVYNGYGAGGTSAGNGTAGYVKIVWKG